MGSSSPRVELPVCFPRRLRSVLALRQESMERFTSRLVGKDLSRAQVITILAGRSRPPEGFLSRMQTVLDAASWAFVMGETHNLDAEAQERAAGLAA